MALFQKKPVVASSAPLYSVGANKTVLIIGLGNPGKNYEGTRHNIGFAIVDSFAKANDFPAWVNKKDLKAQLAITQLGDTRVILAKPQTFMNASGEAGQAIQHFYRVYNHDTLVLYDELAIPFGSLRTRLGGSDAGHNGVKSLIAHLGEDFGRLRIGIGSEISARADTRDFVLGRFTKEEQASLQEIIKEASAVTTEYIFSGSLPHETRKAF